MIVRVLSLLLAAGGSLDLILGAGFSQLSVSFKNLEVICSAQPSSARPGQETLSPSFSQHRQRQQHTPHSTSTQNTQTKRRGRWLLAAVGGWWEEASVFCPWRPFTVRGQPGPPPITVSFYLKCCAVASCAACTIQQHRAQSLSLT